MWDAGQEGCRTQDRSDGGRRDRERKQKEPYILGQHVLDLKSDFTDILCGIKLLNTFFSLKKL